MTKLSYFLAYCKYFIIYFMLLFVLYSRDFWPLQKTNNWTPDLSLGDLQSNLKWMRCSVNSGYDIYNIQTEHGCGGYTYGFVFARTMGMLGVNETHAVLFRYLFAFLFLLTISYHSVFLENALNIKSYLIIPILFSPPAWLSIIHGSLDIPVIFLLTLAWILDKHSSIISFLIVALSSLMKFFTFGLLIYLGFRLIKTYSSLAIRILVLSVTAFVFVNIAIDYSRVDWSNPSYRIASGIFFVFGIESTINWTLVILRKVLYSEIILDSTVTKVAALAVFVVFVGLMYRMRKLIRSNHRRLDRNSEKVEVPQFFLLTFHFLPLFLLFIQGQNWDNKLIFLMVPAFLISKRLNNNFVVLMTFGAFYLSNLWPFDRGSAIFVIAQFMGDFCVSAILILLTCYWISHIEFVFRNRLLTFESFKLNSK